MAADAEADAESEEGFEAESDDDFEKDRVRSARGAEFDASNSEDEDFCSESSEVNNILLIDEIDVFFGEAFYTKNLTPITNIHDDCLGELVKYVYPESRCTTISSWQGNTWGQRPLDIFTDLGVAPVTLHVSWQGTMWDKRPVDFFTDLGALGQKESIFQLAQAHCVKPIVVCGHSLGGGLARLAHVATLGILSQLTEASRDDTRKSIKAALGCMAPVGMIFRGGRLPREHAELFLSDKVYRVSPFLTTSVGVGKHIELSSFSSYSVPYVFVFQVASGTTYDDDEEYFYSLASVSAGTGSFAAAPNVATRESVSSLIKRLCLARDFPL